MQLAWTTPKAAKTVIPASALYPPASPPGGESGESPDSVSMLVYLHDDHLGSVSLATAGDSPTVVSQQEYTPWGTLRSGGVGETARNYTGQLRDGTGLLYYGARYYDPGLARFTSADSIVPGAALGAGGALGTLGADGKMRHRGLTVDYHETGFVSALNGENAFTL